jgi:hypothetical protein
MPSPFPGMNPYIEKAELWRDFHNSFLFALRAAIVPQVVPRYFVRIEQNVYVDDPRDGLTRLRIADVDLGRQPGSRPRPAARAATATPPKRLRVPRLSKREVGYLSIRTPVGNRVLTVIKLLSPSNKDGSADQVSYLVKRRELLASNSSFIELDFLRGGKRMPVIGLGACDYYTLVSRPADRPTVDVCRMKLRDRLPVIPIPLDRAEREPTVDLQDVLNRVYDAAGYEYSIYDEPPEPPLSSADAAWARKLIPASA